jgi:hypothetical protein
VELINLRWLDQRFLIKKSSTFFPFFNAATNHLGLAPLPAQVSPEGERYLGGTFLPISELACFRPTEVPVKHRKLTSQFMGFAVQGFVDVLSKRQKFID